VATGKNANMRIVQWFKMWVLMPTNP